MRRPFSVTIIAISGWLATAQAHHSAAGYDMSARVSLLGTVKEFKFTNPHTWIYLTVTDDKGVEKLWKLEGGSVSHLARNGWNYRSLKAGDLIKVTVAPRTDGEPAGVFMNVQLADGASLDTSK
jgi:hypothetical protein